MLRISPNRLAGLLGVAGACLMIALSGCPGDDTGLNGQTPRRTPAATTSAATNSTQLGGGVSTGSVAASGSPSPGATSSPTSPPGSPSNIPLPTPLQTAAPQVAVTGLVVTPGSATLYPAAQVASLSLGLATSVQLTGYSQMADGSQGALMFSDHSSGQLVVNPSGLVTASATASPGIYYVRVAALSAPSLFEDIPITVGSTGELDTTVQ